LFWESIKWYSDYDEISSIENYLGEISDSKRNEGFKDPYGMIRLGEEPDDVEINGEPYDFNMYVNRSIEF